MAMLGFWSCEENISIEPEAKILENLSEADIVALQKAGVSPDNAFYDTIKRLDGTINRVIRAGDVVLRVDKLDEYVLSNNKNVKRYGSNNLVSYSNRVIRIIGYTGPGLGLSPKMQTGLRWAVNNYNRLNTSLDFRLFFNNNPRVFDSDNDDKGSIIVFSGKTNDTGGVAEFPANGIPGRFIQLFGGNQELSNNVNEHIITHKIGHAIGLRHMDYMFEKCGYDEDSSKLYKTEAIAVSGVQTIIKSKTNDSDSVMISCFDGTEDGEFSDIDIAILESLY